MYFLLLLFRLPMTNLVPESTHHGSHANPDLCEDSTHEPVLMGGFFFLTHQYLSGFISAWFQTENIYKCDFKFWEAVFILRSFPIAAPPETKRAGRDVASQTLWGKRRTAALQLDRPRTWGGSNPEEQKTQSINEEKENTESALFSGVLPKNRQVDI